MRLFKHVAEAQPTTYTIKNISMVELGYIQLALLMAGQPELRTEEDWKPAPVQPKKPSKHGKHEFDASLSWNFHVRRAQGDRPAPGSGWPHQSLPLGSVR